MKGIYIVMVVVAGIVFFSCKSTKASTIDCTPEREKHVNKMHKIPMPSDTIKQLRPKLK